MRMMTKMKQEGRETSWWVSGDQMPSGLENAQQNAQQWEMDTDARDYRRRICKLWHAVFSHAVLLLS